MAGVQLYGWDDTNKKWIVVEVDTEGRIKIVAQIDHLNDLGDVSVPTPTDGHYFYWDDAAGEWKSKSVAADAVAAVEAAGLTLDAGKNIIIPTDGHIQHSQIDDAIKVFGALLGGTPNVFFQPSGGNRVGELSSMPSGTEDAAHLACHNASDLANFGFVDLLIDGAVVRLYASKYGTGTAPTTFYIHFDTLPSGDITKTLGSASFRWTDIFAYHHQFTQALGTDHTWSGNCAPMTAGTALTIGQAVYVGGDSKMEKALATAAATMPALALATGTIAENAVGSFLLQGFFRDDTWNWTIGGLLYISKDTAGALTQTLPAASGEQVQVVGVAISADIIYFNPSFELVEKS